MRLSALRPVKYHLLQVNGYTLRATCCCRWTDTKKPLTEHIKPQCTIFWHRQVFWKLCISASFWCIRDADFKIELFYVLDWVNNSLGMKHPHRNTPCTKRHPQLLVARQKSTVFLAQRFASTLKNNLRQWIHVDCLGWGKKHLSSYVTALGKWKIATGNQALRLS